MTEHADWCFYCLDCGDEQTCICGAVSKRLWPMGQSQPVGLAEWRG
jgi:hypothetical protein